MIVDAADFSDGEFEEDIDGAAASCSEHKILIVMFVFIKTPTNKNRSLTGGRDLPPVGGREAEDLGHHEPGLHAAAEVVTRVGRQPGHSQVIRVLQFRHQLH